MERKLNVRAEAGGATMNARLAFDAHLDTCRACEPHLCSVAEQLWRAVCLTALRQNHANRLAEHSAASGDTVQAEPVVEGHPATSIVPGYAPDGDLRPGFATAASAADWVANHPSTQEAQGF